MTTVDRTSYHFVRSVVVGVRISEAWSRYYGSGGDKHRGAVPLVKSIRTHCFSQAKDESTHSALNLVPWRRLLKQAWFVDIGTKTRSRATFEEWIESLDESAQESFSLRELREIYDSQADTSRSFIAASSKASLSIPGAQQSAILAAIDATLFQARQRPQSGDWLDGWLQRRSVNPLRRAGISTVSQLHERICVEGYGWFRRVPGIGPNRSVRIIQWLHQNGFQVPIERRLPSHAFKDVAVEMDPKVLQWLEQAKSAHTRRAFERETRRFGVWINLELGKRLERATPEDIDQYQSFLARLTDSDEPWTYKRPREDWLGSACVPRGSPAKRLFSREGLSDSSIAYAVRVCRLYVQDANSTKTLNASVGGPTTKEMETENND